MAMQLQGKNALITGSARGIGKAIAQRYLAEGARVMIADINSSHAQATANELGAQWVHMDVTDHSSIAAAVHHCDHTLGGIDILVNNAAVFSAAPLVDITAADYHKVFAINVEGVLFTMQAVARHMIERGTKGCIINMASQAGRRGEPLVAVYCASKAAVISLTQSAGLNLISHGIRVNAIAPGVVDGAHWDEVDALFARYEGKPLGQKKKEVGASVPIGRMAQAHELCGMAVFLASDDAGYIVAQTYNVDGGNWMS